MNVPPNLRIVQSGDFSGQEGLAVHPISSSRELFEIYRMAYDAYRDQQACSSSADGVWIPFPDFDHSSASTILIAERKGEIVGSVSLTFDGPRGLPMDKHAGRMPFLFRNQSGRMAEVWRLVVKGAGDEVQLVAERLLEEAVAQLRSSEIDTAFISVLPPLISLCQTRLRAVTLWSMPVRSDSLSQASTLLRFNLDRVPAQTSQTTPLASFH